MVNQDLLTIFVSLMALAVIIQTGILVGLYFVTNKIAAQAERAAAAARQMVDPVNSLSENLQTVSARIAEAGASVRGQVREFEHSFQRTRQNWHERLANRKAG